ncbi:MAG: hypothetical protein KDE27_27395 [Planctomycetes bacterium]|nr:hypothetical protein [Planctomycetota bacterium]
MKPCAAESRTLPPTIALLVSLSLLAIGVPGQQLRLLDSLGFPAATFDPVRGSLVAIGYEGETREFDGAQWRLRPQPRFHSGLVSGQLLFDPARRRTLFCRADFEGPVELHHYDGVRWQRVVGVGPSPRQDFACAFDAQRGELVLFGGELTGFVTSDETWIHDGSSWSLRNPVTSPPARTRAAMAYDLARGRTVLFGGWPISLPNETWEWDGTNWLRVTPTTAPAHRGEHAMAFDPLQNRVLLFGGRTANGYSDELWDYDGATWTQHSTSPRPSRRGLSVMVFDPLLGETRLLGGWGPLGGHAEEWSWNGVRWLQRTAPPHPGVRGVGTSAAITLADPLGRGLVLYDGARQPPETWLFDGRDWSPIAGQSPPARAGASACDGSPRSYLYGGVGPAGLLTDLWSFDGSAWTLEATSGPTPAYEVGMTHDATRGEVVLFGGAGTAAVLDETWIWNGTTWAQRQPASRPSPRQCRAMAFDHARSRTVLYGGTDYLGGLRDTWEWDGITWTQVFPASTPPPGGYGMAFDLQRNGLVLVASQVVGAPIEAWAFDGVDWTRTVAPIEVPNWMVSPTGFPYPHGVLITDEVAVFSASNTTAAATLYGSACTASAPGLGANEWPRLGAAGFGLDVVRAPASSLIALLGAGQSANVNLGGCVQLVQPGQAVLLLATSPGGIAHSSLPVPSNTPFLGVDLYFQAAALDATAPGGFTMSRGLRVTIGN